MPGGETGGQSRTNDKSGIARHGPFISLWALFLEVFIISSEWELSSLIWFCKHVFKESSHRGGGRDVACRWGGCKVVGWVCFAYMAINFKFSKLYMRALRYMGMLDVNTMTEV